ncbi:MAG: rRNA pseudouridine synthase [Lachnospiraceae bacterium]|nr:rRNA pseudouridine synthase [Lachnospiraceae bacterium]MDE7202981.1 rRNA pseudouridine synthase [Lachnospiraceae bacterium]
MRLDKYLCDMQLGTRSQVKEAIKKGFVSVNGIRVKSPYFKVNERQDDVNYIGNTLAYQNLYYYMFHKPSGVVTATKDHHDPTVMDLLPDACGKELSPVGRLDKDTEGLLLVTNDGELAHKLLSPRKHVEKTYYAECSGVLTADQISLLENGVDIGDEECTQPARVKLLSQTDCSYAIELTITEGRFHQVKRMVQAVGGSVTYLKRLSMGSLTLDPALPKGAYRPLTEKEISDLKLLTSTTSAQ